MGGVTHLLLAGIEAVYFDRYPIALELINGSNTTATKISLNFEIRVGLAPRNYKKLWALKCPSLKYNLLINHHNKQSARAVMRDNSARRFQIVSLGSGKYLLYGGINEDSKVRSVLGVHIRSREAGTTFHFRNKCGSFRRLLRSIRNYQNVI